MAAILTEATAWRQLAREYQMDLFDMVQRAKQGQGKAIATGLAQHYAEVLVNVIQDLQVYASKPFPPDTRIALEHEHLYRTFAANERSRQHMAKLRIGNPNYAQASQYRRELGPDELTPAQIARAEAIVSKGLIYNSQEEKDEADALVAKLRREGSTPAPPQTSTRTSRDGSTTAIGIPEEDPNAPLISE